MAGLPTRIVALLALVVILLGVAGSVLALLQTIDAATALALVTSGGALWVTVVIGLRRVRSTQTTYW